jgi:two-component system, LytTR family, response regulator
MSELRVLIVEDEPPARRRLRALLEAQPGITVLAECGDGRTAVEKIESLEPDLVFLDVEIPELNGMEVIDAVGTARMPAVIFVTAYHQYAVQAFDRAAVDYLLKPFDQERFEQALERGRRMLQRPDDLAVRLSALLGDVARSSADHLAVRTGERIRMVRVSDIDYVSAAGNYVRIHTGSDSMLLRETISALEDRLDPRLFVRVHRSLVVNRTRVRELEGLYRGEYVLWLHDGTRLVSGRTYRSRIQQAFGI